MLQQESMMRRGKQNSISRPRRAIRSTCISLMKHTSKHNPAIVLEGKTPYEMLNKKVPNLAGIQEFGAAAYVKDLKAGKLDACAK